MAALLLGLSLISGEVRAQDKSKESLPENTRYIDSLSLSAGNFSQKLIKVNDQVYIISRSPVAGNIGVFLGANQPRNGLLHQKVVFIVCIPFFAQLSLRVLSVFASCMGRRIAISTLIVSLLTSVTYVVPTKK